MSQPSLPTPGTQYAGPPELQQAYFQTPFPSSTDVSNEQEVLADLMDLRRRQGVIGADGNPAPALPMPAAPGPLDHEVALLSIAMASDKGVEALWALDKLTGPALRDNTKAAVLGQPERPMPTRAQIATDVAQEFIDPRHGEVAKAVLELHTRRKPHDAVGVTDLLRERDLLPLEWDPDVPMVPIDRETYGLAGWERNAMPAESGPVYASLVRENYQPRYLMEVGILAQELGAGAVADPSMTGEARTVVAKKLLDMPPRLDPATLSAVAPVSSTPVDTGALEPVERSLTQDRNLRLPPMPALSAAGMSALGR